MTEIEARAILSAPRPPMNSRDPAPKPAPSRRLAPCPKTPNCVSTQSVDGRQRAAPLPFRGGAEETRRRLLAVLEAWPRTRIVAVEDDYLRAECTSLLFRFVDDVELLLDERERVVHFRSASRVGHSDLGANRRRMRALRRAFLSA